MVFLFIIFSVVQIFPQNNIYKFAPGYYYILDYPINIRSRPDLQGEIIGKLNLNDRVQIIQCMENIQYIDNVYSYWYKINFNEISGYIFGGYIALNRLTYDIDKNGIDDYIYFRYSNSIGSDFIIDSFQDVIIYINNKKITTQNMYRELPENHYWMWCELNSYSYSNNLQGENYIIFALSYSKGDGFPDESYYFRVYGNGNITFEYKRSNVGIGL
ncbi:hypothetical protein FACS189485_21140 [Spirochaetia bacterium]|nr:hypothetical protein FACS189485_21140 [Spirochaetia bacterium]